MPQSFLNIGSCILLEIGGPGRQDSRRATKRDNSHKPINFVTTDQEIMEGVSTYTVVATYYGFVAEYLLVLLQPQL